MREKTQQRRRADPEKYLAIAARSRLKKLLADYGLTPEAYEAIIKACAICGAAPKKLCFDHDHETGAFRGLLCHPCNTALGLFKDDIGTMGAAIEYLKRRKG